MRLIMSRELTSGFDFWSCDHLGMAVDACLHQIWCKYLYPVYIYWFFEIQDGGGRHLGYAML